MLRCVAFACAFLLGCSSEESTPSSVPPTADEACGAGTVTREDDLLVGRMAIDLTNVSRLDLVALQEGQPEHRVQDVPVSPGASEVIVAPAMPMVRRLGFRRIRFRLLAPESDGERLLGEYTFDHSPSDR